MFGGESFEEANFASGMTRVFETLFEITEETKNTASFLTTIAIRSVHFVREEKVDCETVEFVYIRGGCLFSSFFLIQSTEVGSVGIRVTDVRTECTRFNRLKKL